MTEPLPIVPIPAEVCDQFARLLRIETQTAGGEERLWEPTRQQREQWKHGESKRQMFVLKARQIYLTTAELLQDLLFTVLNTERGHRIETWLVWDTDEKAREKLSIIEDWAGQLGIECRKSGNALLFGRGAGRKPSAIRAFTAGGKRTGAGLTAHRVHVSELPFFQDPSRFLISLGPALGLSGRCVIETTMAPNPGPCISLWRENKAFSNVFYSVASHDAYKASPTENDGRVPQDEWEPLSPDFEDWIRDEWPTNLPYDRECAAFLQWALVAKVAGDKAELLREYPLGVEHCFALAAGRWIKTTPIVMDFRAETIERGDGKPPLTAEIYVEPEHIRQKALIGVDTSGGLGGDSSAVVVMAEDKEVLATFYSNHAPISDLCVVVDHLRDMYTHRPRRKHVILRDPEPIPPVVIVEANGIGRAVIQELELQHDIEPATYNATRDRRYSALLEVQREVDAGVVFAGEDLKNECELLHVDKGDFRGPKDMCSAIGFILLYLLLEHAHTAGEADGLAPHLRFSFGDWFDE